MYYIFIPLFLLSYELAAPIGVAENPFFFLAYTYKQLILYSSSSTELHSTFYQLTLKVLYYWKYSNKVKYINISLL